MSLLPGSRVGPYRVTGKLGAGGMGEVYRASDSRLGRDVAIKALPVEFARDPERLARFEREAKLLASLSHPNIAGIHGLETVEGVPYLVLEFVDGESLAARLARGAMPVDEALEVARQIAAGLEAAHESGVVHRDLKPGNVMLTPGGTVKVLDFGLAKVDTVGGSSSELNLSTSPTQTRAATQAGVILGTAAYMSPEQARGRAVDKRSDIWSFGCVLYECLVGRPMFAGETVSDLIASILQAEPDWEALPAGVPAHIQVLLRRCLRKDVKERLRDIGEARILLGAPPESLPVPAVAARAGRGVSWGIATALAVAAGVIAMVATFRFAEPNRRGPLRKFDLVTNDMVSDWPMAPRLSPDGTRYAYATAQHLCVRDLDELVPRVVSDIAAATTFGWSPDSRELVYSNNRKLWKVAIAGGRPTAICEIPATGSLLGVTWAGSGTIAFSVWRDNLYQVASAGGSPQPLVRINAETQVDFHTPVWLPGGQLLYVVHWKSRRDSTGVEPSALMLLDGDRPIPIAGYPDTPDDALAVTASGHVFYRAGGAAPGICAARLDLKAHRLVGTPVLIAPDASSISAAADGSLLYMQGSALDVPNELVWVDRTGSTIGSVGHPHKDLSGQRLSPDGKRVVFSATDEGNQDIWVLNLGTGIETRLTFTTKEESSPEWLDNLRISYTEPDGIEGRVFALNADGTGGQRPFAPKAPMGWVDTNAMLSHDGRSAIRILDNRGRGSLQIGVIQADGTLGPTRRLLVQEPEPDVGEARLSPDGGLVAYRTSDPGRPDVFVTRFPAGLGQWQVGSDGGSRPRWAGKSRELFFVSGSGMSKRELVAVSIDPAEDPPLGATTRLFEASSGSNFGDYDVSADGQRVLLSRPVGGGSTAASHLVLVQNWAAALEGMK